MEPTNQEKRPLEATILCQATQIDEGRFGSSWEKWYAAQLKRRSFSAAFR